MAVPPRKRRRPRIAVTEEVAEARRLATQQRNARRQRYLGSIILSESKSVDLAAQVIDMANIGKRAIRYLHKLSAANIRADLIENG
ncbi:hypothetical protein DCAR_0832355 [Daucus carota subsp. sativus]|uniref:Uncharacterized protein n=1 Tax=Daucus carota subsp. sativus TaxID=79200 RepID=A0A175YRB6_DAUCS|nr:hypothetical protein DCAR_0832355 [Daucus carota subsp. sativus]